MKFWKKAEGAISVFLVIILVPCLFISALFVDMGRLYLSQGMAYSSADLALNSVLTKYDSVLNEYYGLVASCQNMNEFYDASEDYFLRTISSQNLEEDEIKLLSDTFSSVVKSVIGSGDDVSDMLDAEPVGDVTISPVSEANLSNSALLKEQIVEFMKYRGPITIVSSIVGIFKNADGTNKAGVDAVLDADTDKPIIDAKQKFHDSESAFLSEAYKTYSYLYNNYSKYPIETDSIVQKVESASQTVQAYRTIHSVMVGNFYNTEKVVPFNRPQVSLNEFEDDYSKEGVATSSKEENGTTVYYITWEYLNQRKTDLEKKKKNFTDAIQDCCKAVSGINPGTDRHDVQYWAKVDEIIFARNGGTKYIEAITNTARAMFDAYQLLLVSIECTPDGEGFPANYMEDCRDLLNEVKDLQGKYLQKPSTVSSSDSYLTLVKDLESISHAQIYNVTPSSKVIKDDKTAGTLIAEIQLELKTTRDLCASYVDILNTVIDGGTVTIAGQEETLLPLSDLVALAETYKANYEEYKTTVENAPDTTLKQKMEDDINNGDYTKYDEIVSGEAVETMKQRLSNIRRQFSSVVTAIENMKYGGVQMIEIPDYATFKNASKTVVKAGDIGITKSSVNAETNRSWAALMVPNLSSNQKIVEINTVDDSYDLYLKPEPEFNKVDVPELYTFFYNKFGVPNDEAVNQQEEEMETAKKDAGANDSANIAKTKLYTPSNPVKVVWSKNSSAKFGMGASVDSLITLFTDLSKGNFTDIRDKAYIAAYILEMFSYATYEREGQYDLYEKIVGKEAMTSLTEGTYEQLYLDNVVGEDKGKWGSTSTLDYYNKTLTNKMINATNNAAYLSELEYILYGNASNEENVKAACGDIFALRLILNTISGFIHFWSGGDPTSTAIASAGIAVSGLSCGVIPVSAVKAVLIMILVALETSNDISRLACGFPVELYKSEKSEWLFSITGLVGAKPSISDIKTAFKTMGIDKVRNTGEGFTYGDYVKLFVCLAVWGDENAEGTGLPETVMLRVADLIETNMQHITNKRFSLENSYTHFELKAKLSVDPLIVNISLFDEYNEELRDTTGWMEYEVNAIRGY